jgi:hypothetical protein
MANTMYTDSVRIVATADKTDAEVHQDALAHVSMRLIQDVGLQADSSYRHGLQREQGDRHRTIEYQGRWITPREADQIAHDERLALQLQQGAAATAGPTSHRAVTRREWQNGLSNHPVDQAIKENGGLRSSAMNKSNRSLDSITPPFMLPRAGPRHASYDPTQSPMRVTSPFGPFGAQSHTPGVIANQMQPTGPALHAQLEPSPRTYARSQKQAICEYLHEELKYHLAPIARVDRLMMSLYNRLFDAATPGHIDAFVGGELRNGRPLSELRSDNGVTELQEHLRKVFFPSPSK